MSLIPPIPHIELPDKEIMEKLQNSDRPQNPKVKEAVQQVLDREKRFKRKARREWWKTNWISITTLIATLLTLIATIIFGLIQVLR